MKMRTKKPNGKRQGSMDQDVAHWCHSERLLRIGRSRSGIHSPCSIHPELFVVVPRSLSELGQRSVDSWRKVEGEKGLFYKQHYLSPAFKFGEQVSALIPQNKRIKDVLEKSKPKRLSHLEQLERHKDCFKLIQLTVAQYSHNYETK